jgi:hypothetical protein
VDPEHVTAEAASLRWNPTGFDFDSGRGDATAGPTSLLFTSLILIFC